MKYGVLLGCMLPVFLSAQPFILQGNVPFYENGQKLTNAFAGGLDQPQPSLADLNGDNRKDLFIFDRAGDWTNVFLNSGEAAAPVYSYAPELKELLPPLRDWVLLRDYNCDGKADIFTALPDSSAIRVYQNTSQGSSLSFVLAYPKLTVPGGVITVFETDIPAIADVDGDGDLDILSFDNQGSHVRFYENTGGCSNLSFVVNTNCWGQFQEAGLTNEITLNTACKRGEDGNSAHSGSTLCTLDIEGDSALELLLGDLSNTNIVYLHNGGTAELALMDQVNMAFPSGNPVLLQQFPAAFSLDIDDDGLLDLLFAPNAPNISFNRENLWWYENTGLPQAASFTFRQKDFLAETMVDVGSVSYPVFFDYNSDGLVDLIIGNYLSRDPDQPEVSGLALYENTGTPTQPEFQLVTRNYLNLPTLFNPPLFGVYPTFGDMDADGDEDLMIGEETGAIHYFANLAGPGNPADFVLTTPFYFGIDVGNSATPVIADVNQDDLPDLVIGEKSGNLEYYQNTGTPEIPAFGGGNKTFGAVDVMPECCTGYSVPWFFRNSQGNGELLVGSENGNIYHFGEIANHLNDTFPLITAQYGNIREGTRISVSGKDITSDGKPEIAIGNLRGGISIYGTNPANSIQTFSGFPQLILYPNPAISPGFLNIKMEPFSPFHLEIFSVQGQKIFQKTINQAAQAMPVLSPEISPGMYLVRILLPDGRTFSQKWWVIPDF